MSSILRALKKLEKEMPDDAPASEDAVQIDIRSTVRRRLWRGYLLQKFSLVASVCILVFLMFWLMRNQPILFKGVKPSSQTPVETGASQGKPAAQNVQEGDNVSFTTDESLLASLPETSEKDSVSNAGENAVRPAASRPAIEKKQSKLLQKKSGEPALPAASASPVKTEKGVSPSAGSMPNRQNISPPEIQRSAPSSAGSAERAEKKIVDPENNGGPDVSDGLTDVDLLLDVVEMPEVEASHQRTVKPEAVAATKPVQKRPRKAVPPVSRPVQKEKKAEKNQKEKAPVSEAAVEADEKTAYQPTPQDRAYQQLPERVETETGLEIQALVWSPDPEERFTVVNGDILKIGAFVDDVSVQYIGENFVVLQKKGIRWQQKMQVR